MGIADVGSPMNRREFLRSAGLLGLAAGAAPLLQACGSSEDVPRLSFLNWQDYIDPAVIGQFEARTGIDVSYQTYASNDELETLLVQSGRPRRGGRIGSTFDLIVPSDNFVRRFRRLDLIEEIDRSRIRNLANLRPEFRNAAFDPGNRFTIPWATGTTGIGYDSTVLTEPPGWDVFLDERFRGRMTMLEEIRDAYAAALLSLGEDANATSQAAIDAATQQLIRMKAVIRGFDSTTYLDDLATGELVVAQAYSSDLSEARSRNPQLEFVIPPEGGGRWVDSLAVPAEAPHRPNAFAFMDYYLQPEVSAQVANFVKVDTGNAAAVGLLDPDVRTDPVVFPPEDVLSRTVFTEDLGGVEDLYRAGWKQVQSA